MLPITENQIGSRGIIEARSTRAPRAIRRSRADAGDQLWGGGDADSAIA